MTAHRPLGLLKRLLSRPQPPPELEYLVGQYLLELPRCTARVLIAGSVYGQRQYRCNLVADASLLLPWAERHAERVFSTWPHEQAARLALPIWLRGAGLSNRAASSVPTPFVGVLNGYVGQFLKDSIAEAYCLDCGSTVTNVTQWKLFSKDDGIRQTWTDDWRCPDGHLLYRQQQDWSACGLS